MIVKEFGFLNVSKLCQDGLIFVGTDQTNQLIPLGKDVQTVSADEIYIRLGQLNCVKKINGLGRKITLVPLYSGIKDKKIKSFDEELTLCEEGQLNNDQLDSTFGRRISMNGQAQIGWFQTSGGKLHGYGKTVSKNNPRKDAQGRLFEAGRTMASELEIKQYDSTDHKAQTVDFDFYAIMD